ncbi:MAG: flagellar hook protein FlgE [Pseudomonadota bacterium]
MSIGSALQAGVSGLRSQGNRLATISDNIANSATVGYKRGDVQFSSLVTGSGASRGTYSAGGVTTNNRTEITREGVPISSTSPTDLAIGGDGFFVVNDDPTNSPGASFALTRAGAFAPDENGDLRNSAGLYLQGFALNPDGSFVGGAPSLETFQSLETVNIGSLNFTGDPTTQLSFAGNIPASAAPGDVFESGITYYDDFGTAQTLNLQWENTGPNQWTFRIADPVTPANNIEFAGIDFGTLTPGAPDYPAGGAVNGVGFTLGGFNPATGAIDFTVNGQAITLTLGAEDSFEGVAQFDGSYLPTTTRNGSGFGEVEAIEMSDDGVLSAIFSSGLRRPLYQVPLSDVVNPDGLVALDGNAYRISNESGDFRLFTAGSGPVGAVIGNALENSNVDIAEELTALIETQRAYSSNATIVRTADEMLEETTRLKR